MNIDRARKLLPPNAVITASCRPNFYGGAWVVWAEYTAHDVREKRPVTQFAEPFNAARWVNAWYNNER